MIVVSDTKPEWIDKIPGVVHKNRSARVQTVSKELNSSYYELISEFKKLTGISVLVNTSFNDRGMPIVETVDDAIQFFLKAKKIDVLCVHDYIIKRRT